MEIKRKLAILADAAKYDASCASSGSARKASPGGIGNTEGMGICHSYTPDGRCVSLLKVLLTNICIYDCQYCVNRISSDVERARFAPREIVDLTLASFLGPKFSVTHSRGQVFETRWAPLWMATYHPAALLRMPDATARDAARRHFEADIAKAAFLLKSAGSPAAAPEAAPSMTHGRPCPRPARR